MYHFFFENSLKYYVLLHEMNIGFDFFNISCEKKACYINMFKFLSSMIESPDLILFLRL